MNDIISFPIKKHYRPDEVAKGFNISPRTVRNWISIGFLGSVRIRGSIRIPAEELDRLIENAIEEGKARQASAPEFLAKQIAHRAVALALVLGKITKPEFCSKCLTKTDLLQGHHEDYQKPLEVIWLCRKCHISLHARKRLVKTK